MNQNLIKEFVNMFHLKDIKIYFNQFFNILNVSIILRILEYFNDVKGNFELNISKNSRKKISFYSDLKINVTESDFHFFFFYFAPIFPLQIDNRYHWNN